MRTLTRTEYDEEQRRERQIRCEENAKQEREFRRATAIAALDELPPGLLRDFDLAKHPSPDAHSRTMRWQPGPLGLMLHGPTGRGKTRSFMQLVAQLADQGVRCRFCPAALLADRLSAIALESASAFDRFVTSLEESEVLVLDDVGASRSSQRIATALHRVIDTRYAHGRPLLLSTNCKPECLQHHLFDEYGRTLRRLRETTTAIAF